MIFTFFKEHGIWYLIYLSLSLSFFAIFYLYGLPLAYFYYSLLVNLVLLLLMTGWLYYHFRQKMLDLKLAKPSQYQTIFNQLKAPSDLAYQNIIEQLLTQVDEQELQTRIKEGQRVRMIKIWSHQMKIPLATLSLMEQTGQLNPRDVQLQILRLENDLNRLLNYLKFTENQSDFRFENCQVKESLVQLIKKNQVLFRQKNLSVAIKGEWQLQTDKKWLSFALEQLLDNAIKYSKTNGRIMITLDQGVTISDNGIGILPEDLPRLFEEGFTGYNGHQHLKATGLGLYMTKTILDQLSLKISITNQLNQGTQVSITKENCHPFYLNKEAPR